MCCYVNMDEAKKDDDLQFLQSLIKSKKHGKLDTNEYSQMQKLKWRSILDYKLLEKWLTGSCEEFRLCTLQLLTVSKKSTLTFTEKELKLIIIFLKYNLREKIEHVPIIKKILKRVNDSYAVLKRQIDRENTLKDLQKLHPELTYPFEDLSDVKNCIRFYQEFVISIHQICLNGLYSGAVNICKKSSLQILCLMEEFLCEELKSSLWNLHGFKILFDCLLLDTYELNKDMAFKLMKSCKLIDSFFDTKEKILELINVAEQMGNSLRPLDGITAAYMLRISLLTSNIKEILLELTSFKKTDDIEEEATFYMIMLIKMFLKIPVKLAVENIVVAVSKHSLYGYILCIHSILCTINLGNIVNDKYWKNIISDIINICFKLNIAAAEIVNNSSPEGHLPMDLNPYHLNNKDKEEIIITPQMVLLCSWRTVKEISLLFGYLTSHASIFNQKNKTGLLTEKQINEIGNQLVSLLCETKHRGAFEQAHVGFGQLCNRLWHLNEEQMFLKELPIIWLQQLLIAVIRSTPENSKLCATRRSAGVPFMVQALVTSEIKKHNDPKTLTFQSVMRILFKLVTVKDNCNLNYVENLLFSETLFTEHKTLNCLSKINNMESKNMVLNEVTEIKTHALNILRALFRHCLLGDLVKDYIAEGFITAFNSYDGKSWAERNAATLLFSSLVGRVFGCQRTKDHINLTLHNKMTGKNFFEKFPTLLPFLLNELTIFINESENQVKPKIQSILLILSRLYPSVTSEVLDDDWKIDQFIDLVSQCGKSRVYKTRELAARALIPLLTEKNILSVSCNLVQSMDSTDISLNLLHGYGLQLLQLIRSEQFSTIELPYDNLRIFLNLLNTKILSNLKRSSEHLVCFPVCTTTLEILIELIKLDLYSWIYKDSIFLNLLEKIKVDLTNTKVLSRCCGIELYKVTAVNLLITTLGNENYSNLLMNNEYTAAELWEKILTNKNEEILTVSWSKFIYIIQKTNSPILYDLGFMTSIKTLDEPIDNPDLQAAIYEFIYKAIIDMESNIDYIQYTFSKKEEKMVMCMYIFNKLSQQLKMDTFYGRGEFFKLFGKTFGILLESYKDIEILKESKVTIYDAFLNYSGMESNVDCRLGISEVLFDLYIATAMNNDIYFILNWWTTLLKLLLDDYFPVRSNAAKILCKFLPEIKQNCEAIIIDSFFAKFVSMISYDVQAIVAAFFCWIIISSAAVLEEMDKTDVFNKSCNFECFDPLLIKDKCILHLKQIGSQHKLDLKRISKPINEWIRKQLKIEKDHKFQSLIELIDKYENMIPDNEKALNRILDPTYSAKLIKEIAYHDFKKVVLSNFSNPS